MIDDYLAQDVWVKTRRFADAYGQPQFSAATKTTGRWIEKRRLVRNEKGEQVTSEVSVTVGPEVVVAAGDAVSADNGSYLVVITVSASRDLGGAVVLRRAFC